MLDLYVYYKFFHSTFYFVSGFNFKGRNKKDSIIRRITQHSYLPPVPRGSIEDPFNVETKDKIEIFTAKIIRGSRWTFLSVRIDCVESTLCLTAFRPDSAWFPVARRTFTIDFRPVDRRIRQNISLDKSLLENYCRLNRLPITPVLDCNVEWSTHNLKRGC